MPKFAQQANMAQTTPNNYEKHAETGATIAMWATRVPAHKRVKNKKQEVRHDMQQRMMHPNTRTLLDAWRRMATAPDEIGQGPQASEYPSLIDRLFVLRCTHDGAWVFANAGSAMNDLVGRELNDHDFLGLWSGNDRLITSAALDTIAQEGEPCIIRLLGETLRGHRCEIEMPLTPLQGQSGLRILGLYQALGGEAMLSGRTIWRHRITSLQMPNKRSEEPRIRLVASND